MESQDIEQVLKGAKFRHLSEATLLSYRDQQLDEIGLLLADAHLRLCVICNRRLTFLKEEQEALESYAITETDSALIERALRQAELETITSDHLQKITSVEIAPAEIQRLGSYIRDLLVAWVAPFSEPAYRGADDGEEVWRYESKDGLLTAWATLERNASLTVHLSSPELAWDGVPIRFRLGPFRKEVELRREGDSRVAASIEIPRRERAKNMADISIEVS